MAKKKRPEKLSLGSIVAQRSFALFKRDDTPVQVSVRLGTPFVGRKSGVPGHDEYRCPVQILGIGKENVVAVWGEDPFVALQSAIDYIGLKLDQLVRQENLEIRSRSSRSGWIWRDPPHYWQALPRKIAVKTTATSGRDRTHLITPVSTPRAAWRPRAKEPHHKT